MEDLNSEMDDYWLKGAKGDDKAGQKGQEILDNQMESYWAEKPSDADAGATETTTTEEATMEAAEPPAAPAE